MIWAWSGFLLFIAVVLALDLGVFNRKAHAPTLREATFFTAGTVVMALCFGLAIHFAYEAHWLGLGLAVDAVDGQVNDGRLAAVKFLTGYVVELSLSMDNVFVMALIFEHLRIPLIYQHRVLFWGILGALVMRGTMIGGMSAAPSGSGTSTRARRWPSVATPRRVAVAPPLVACIWMPLR